MKFMLSTLAALSLTAGASFAQTNARPVVVELFTSQGCSSCPPADAIVAQLARDRADLLPLTFHVTYWNRLGWTDPFSFPAATERQQHYVAMSVSPNVYTPAMVIDGEQDVVGSDRAAVAGALFRAAARAKSGVAIEGVRSGADVAVSLGAGAGSGTVLLIGYDRQHETKVGRGENSGRILLEVNVVRSMTVIGSWTGQATHFRATVPAGEEVAVLVQADDGHFVAAKRLQAPART